tara:strand:- start:23 stop:1132 length:1110 start_codon:yes stop_codon:yes gene_type:complete
MDFFKNNFLKNTKVNDINIENMTELITPNNLHKKLQTTHKIITFVKKTRNDISNILSGKDKRKLMIIGPCSIHNIEMAKEYGLKLKEISKKYKEKILIVMRVYFEKPRTTIGWKGLINDPDLDNSFNINKGLELARKLLLFLNENEIPCGYEILDTFTPQYICDLISWGAIGARTTESQVHRQLVSGLSMPVGFKNNSSGDMDIAANAMISAYYPHCFYGINGDGKAVIVKTNGNKDTHVILRGSKFGTNYDIDSINEMKNTLENKKQRENVMIDCSHGNSNKNYKNQMSVIDNTVKILCENRLAVMGLMVESNLVEGNQKLVFGESEKLEWGKSITDGCVNLEETEQMIKKIYNVLYFPTMKHVFDGF